MQLSLNRQTGLMPCDWVTSLLPVLELRAETGMFLRSFCALSHRTGSRKLLESSKNV